MRYISATEIKEYREEHGVSMSEARSAVEKAAKDEYIKELENLALLMYEGFVLGYVDLLDQDEQMKIIDEIVEKMHKFDIEARYDDPDPAYEDD